MLCVVEDLGRDLAVARAARAGRFVHAGAALELGRRPDWLRGGLATDPEWRIEWVKLYEGLDLAHAWSVTGDREFLSTWEDLVETFCEQVPVGHDSSDVSARRVQNWLYAWQRFSAGPAYPGLRPGLAQRVVDRIEADARHLRDHLTPERNHRTLELYTLFLVGLALDADHDRARRALADLAVNAGSDIWEDGVHRECSTDYHLIVLRSFLGAIANARDAGLPVPPTLVDRADRACDFALHVQRPDGLTPAISDGDPGDFRPLLALGARLLDRGDLAWAASGGRRGTPPRRRLVSFPVGGYHVQRSGWGEHGRRYRDERYCILDCGPLGDGGHGHYDQLSVEIAAGGRALLVDPGRYTYVDDHAGWRRWFKGTAAHNTVCVDGLDQTPYRPGKPGVATSTARLLGRWTGPGLDLIRGEVTSPCYDAVHTRTVAFVDDDYWIVHDRLRARTPHRYTARWQLTPAALPDTVVDLDADQAVVRAPGLVLAVPHGHGRVDLDTGWVSPRYGVKEPAPVAVVTAANATDTDLLTVVVPDPVDRPDPARVRVAARCGAGRVQVRVHRAGVAVDTVWWAFDTDRSGWEREAC